MGTLREQIESALSETLEGPYGLPCPITYTDGAIQTKNASDATLDLMAQVIYETPEVNLDTGDTKLIPQTIITYRRTSLDKIPAPGDKIKISIPDRPTESADYITVMATPDNEPRHGRSIGIISFYVQNVVQSV